MNSNFINFFFKNSDGLPYSRILKYFYPEFISALIIYFLPNFIDCYFICNLKSTEIYAVSGIVENMLSFFTKSAEAFLIGTVIISGYFNGKSEFKKSGESFIDGFWTTILFGIIASIGLYYGAPFFFKFNNFNSSMIEVGTPYLKVKSVGVFFLFLYFSLVGFLRAVKNTFIPMVIFTIGNLSFILFDYLLIFGKFGFPKMGLLGSAVSYLIQYILMSVLMIVYLTIAEKYKKYQIGFLPKKINIKNIKKFIFISGPVILDKTSIAFAYIWLASSISLLGGTAAASYSMIKLMERIAFVPAIALSQIITFLVSNDLGEGRCDKINGNIKKTVFLASIMVGFILIISSLWPSMIVIFYGCSDEICFLVSSVFPSLSILVMFDLLQLLLSGALRGAGDVKTVMITRLIVIICYFIPVSYFVIPMLPIYATSTKIIVTYGAFLVGNGMMTIVYIIRLRQNYWKKKNIKVVDE